MIDIFMNAVEATVYLVLGVSVAVVFIGLLALLLQIIFFLPF